MNMLEEKDQRDGTIASEQVNIPTTSPEPVSNKYENNYDGWTKEELINEIKKLRKRKRYGLVWEEKDEQVVKKCNEFLPILREVTEKSISVHNIDNLNILIEGDNYHSLSVLNYTHDRAVDVIYIDPPYNLGNGDFIYNDKIVDKEDAYRHSKWLSFMNSRIKLAKSLLKPEGIIFISIDENEFSQLKLLCDNIFDEKNYIGTFVWRKKAGAGADSKLIFIQHDYVLFYSKNKDKLERFYQPLNKKQKKEYKNPDNDPRGPWAQTDLTAPSSDTDDKRLYKIISPLTGKEWLKRWSYTKENFEKLLEDNLVWFGKSGNSTPKRKRFLSEKEGLVPRSLIDFVLTSDGKKDLESIFGKESRVFDYPKPVELVKHLIRLNGKKDSLVLDFFAGSGTTGQAVVETNSEDGGNRRFILCTNNENLIAENVCYPRIKTVILRNDENKELKSSESSLKYFKTDFVEALETDSNKKQLVDSSTEMLCLKEYCFNLISNGKYYKIFNGAEYKLLCIIYDDDGIEEAKIQLKNIGKKAIVYVFSLDDGNKEDEFTDLIDLIEIKPIPASILNVYRRIFK